jgi:Asp-tRNA(Asn)/Glu-tRNA(Gln) amidotransferase B subunit
MIQGDSRLAEDIVATENIFKIDDESNLKQLILQVFQSIFEYVNSPFLLKVLHDNPVAVKKYISRPQKAHRTRAFFVGEIMKITSGLSRNCFFSESMQQLLD